MRPEEEQQEPETGEPEVAECACPSRSGLFPHPASCAHICQCIMGSPKVLTCPEGQQFHSKLLKCVQRGLSDCVITSRPKVKKKQPKNSTYNGLISRFSPNQAQPLHYVHESSHENILDKFS